MSSLRQVLVHTFDSLHYYPNYRFLWGATIFFSGAFWLQQLIIGWLAYELTQSALLTSLAMGLDVLPILIAGPVGGPIVDRFDKRKLLASMSMYKMTLALIFGVLILTGVANIWFLFCFVFLIGSSWVITDPARMALIPEIVPRHNFVNAFALHAVAVSLTRLIIPAVGGLLLATAGAGPAMLFEGMLVAGASIILWLDVKPIVRNTRTHISAVFADLVYGLRYVRETPIVLGLLLFALVPPVLVMPFWHWLIPVYAAEVYRVGPAMLGLMMADVGIGFLSGTLLLAFIGETGRKGWLIIGCISIISISMLVFALNTSFVMAYPILAVGSSGLMGFMSISSAALQDVLPDRLRGRIAAIYATTYGALPLGSIVSGIISESFNANAATLIASGCVAVVSTILIVKFPEIKDLD